MSAARGASGARCVIAISVSLGGTAHAAVSPGAGNPATGCAAVLGGRPVGGYRHLGQRRRARLGPARQRRDRLRRPELALTRRRPPAARPAPPSASHSPPADRPRPRPPRATPGWSPSTARRPRAIPPTPTPVEPATRSAWPSPRSAPSPSSARATPARRSRPASAAPSRRSRPAAEPSPPRPPATPAAVTRWRSPASSPRSNAQSGDTGTATALTGIDARPRRLPAPGVATIGRSGHDRRRRRHRGQPGQFGDDQHPVRGQRRGREHVAERRHLLLARRPTR